MCARPTRARSAGLAARPHAGRARHARRRRQLVLRLDRRRLLPLGGDGEIGDMKIVLRSQHRRQRSLALTLSRRVLASGHGGHRGRHYRLDLQALG